jgi:hypothetical protein
LFLLQILSISQLQQTSSSGFRLVFPAIGHCMVQYYSRKDDACLAFCHVIHTDM